VVFTAVKIQVEVFWVVTPCSDATGYHKDLGIVAILPHHYRCHNPEDLNLKLEGYSMNEPLRIKKKR
jgi:hypothetical protein